MAKKTAKKEIVISFDEKGRAAFHTKGLSGVEILGALRLFEKKMSLHLLKTLSE